MWNTVEKSDKVVIDGCEVDVVWCVAKMPLELVAEAGDGELARMLR